MCDAAMARVAGDFARSSNILLQALHEAERFRDLPQTINPIQIMLRNVHIGNLMLMGRVGDWAEETEHLQSGFYTPVRAYYNISDLRFRNMDFLKLNLPAHAIPDSTREGPLSDLSIWTRPRASSKIRPRFQRRQPH